MLFSSLLTHTGYNDRLYKLWANQKPPRSSLPSISRIQQLIEQAWGQGFDLQVNKSNIFLAFISNGDCVLVQSSVNILFACKSEEGEYKYVC